MFLDISIHIWNTPSAVRARALKYALFVIGVGGEGGWFSYSVQGTCCWRKTFLLIDVAFITS